MCDPILVPLLKMQPHYSQSSRENATLSSGTSPLASYTEVPASPRPPRPGHHTKDNARFYRFIPDSETVTIIVVSFFFIHRILLEQQS